MASGAATLVAGAPRAARTGRETTSGQKRISPRCCARARRQKYGARRCLSPKANAIAPRGFARCKMSALCTKTGGLFFVPQAALRKTAGLVLRINQSGHQSNRFTACRWRFALTPENARHSAPLIRLDAGTGRATSPDAPTKYRERRGSVVMQECFRDITQHTLSVWSWWPCANTPTLILFGPTTPRTRDPSCRN